jgi:PAS domain S-box-containing protein
MKLTLKVLGISAAVIALAAGLLLLDLRHFDRLYRDRQLRTSELNRQIIQVRSLQVDFKKQVQEWKNILLRGHVPADLDKYTSLFLKSESDVNQGVRQVLERIEDPAVRSKLEEFEQAHRNLGGSYRTALASFVQTLDIHASDRLVRGQDRRPTDMLDDVVAAMDASFAQMSAGLSASWETEWRRALGVTAASLLGLLVILGFLGTSVTRPIVALARTMKVLAREETPDLRVSSTRKDEIGDLFGAFNDMLIAVRERDAALVRDRRVLADREERLRSFTQNVSDGILSLDSEGQILTWNQAAGEMLGYSAAEVLGKPLLMMISAEHQPRTIDVIRQLFEDAQEGTARKRLEIDGLRKDGTRIVLELSLASWKGGADVYLGAILRDITEQKKVARLKDEFISTVSHELRTPLTAIRGSLGMLAGGVIADIPARAKSMIVLAHKNCERLSRLVNDILDMEKLESGKLTFNLKPIRLLSLVQQAVDMNRAFGDQLGVQFVLQENPSNAQVQADSDRILQVLTNLLSNAAKFSPRGECVSLSVVGDQKDVRVSIRDHGPGISDEFRKRIFQKFAQAETSDARIRQGQGTGLGLSITKAMIERMRGTIGFDTKPGEGTTFFFTLPLLADPSASPKPATGPFAALCDLNSELEAIVREALGRYGIAPISVPANGLLEPHLGDPQCKAVFMRSSVRGEDLSPWLQKEDPRSQKCLPKLFLLSDRPEIESPACDPAKDDVLRVAAPVNVRELSALLHRSLTPLEARMARILHVDASAKGRESATDTLGPICRIVSAATIGEGWNRLREQEFDLLLLDLHLPDGCSLDLVPSLRGLAKQDLPVVLYSDARAPKNTPAAVRVALPQSGTSPEQLVTTIRSLVATAAARTSRQGRAKARPAGKGNAMLAGV